MAAVVVEYLVVPQVAGTRHAIHLLGRLQPEWLIAGIGLQAASLAAYTQLTRSLLPKDTPSFRRTAGITVATLGISHVVPAGSVAGTGLGYRLLRDSGVPATDAGFALGTQSIGSAAVLNVLLWVGLLVTIPLHGFRPLYVTAAVLGAVLLSLIGLSIFGLLTNRDGVALRVCRAASHVPMVDENAVAEALRRVADRLRGIAADRALVRRLVLWSAASWLLDAACLWVFVAAFGVRVSPDAIIVAHGLGNVLAAIPITPGGLGVTEATISLLLVSFGVPRGPAVLAVLSYRLIEFWLPIPLGALSWLSLEVDKVADRRRLAALGDVAADAVNAAPPLRDWALEHGVALPTKRR